MADLDGVCGVSGGQPDSPAGPLIQVAFGTALAGFVTALLGTSVAGSTGNLTAGILIRGLLGLLAVLLICRSFGHQAKQRGLERPALLTVGGALLGFGLDPLSWQARTALTQLATEPGVLTVLGDLALWLLVAAGGAQLGARSTTGPVPATTPYG
jgi:hypothetical protein